MTTAIVAVSTQQVEQYKHQGFLIVPGLYTANEMLEWKALLQEMLAKEAANPTGVRVWSTQDLPRPLLAAMKDDKVSPVLTQLIGPNVEFLSAKAVFKNGKTVFPSPMHQDWFYWEG